MENLEDYVDIVCEFALYAFNESWISSGCSYEFNVVYMQREKKSQICYTKTTYEVHAFKVENK